jgi:hypothetical protein
MCDEVSSTREHVPPQCFFPNGQRENLWTVPSCALHNLGNSKDVEYVRNVLVTQRGTNETASELFQVVKRSWDRSPALFSRTFHDFRTALVEGEEAGVFPFDLPRIKAVMTAVCHALAFRDFGRQVPRRLAHCLPYAGLHCAHARVRQTSIGSRCGRVQPNPNAALWCLHVRRPTNGTSRIAP